MKNGVVSSFMYFVLFEEQYRVLSLEVIFESKGLLSKGLREQRKVIENKRETKL